MTRFLPSRASHPGMRRAVSAAGVALVALALVIPGAAQSADRPDTFANLADELLPTVVNISTTQKADEDDDARQKFEEFFRKFFEERGEGREPPQHPRRRPSSLGSGFVIDSSGYIVTNSHVLADADEVTVRFHDDTTKTAEIVGRDEKTEMGLAEHTEGRGFENVAANGAVALTSAVAYAAAPNPTVELAAAFAFVGCMATAAADTASSEIGTVTGYPRLITTFEHVPPGTDGGVSWQGEGVTVVAVTIVGTASVLFGVLQPPGAFVAAFAGLVGAHVDSVLGATVEGRYLGNNGVNLSACTTGALVAASFAFF